LDAKKIFDHFVNAASALVGTEDPPRREPTAQIPKLKQFGNTLGASFAPSCCIAKRPVGPGKLPKMREPSSE